jgi:hypothetical protein
VWQKYNNRLVDSSPKRSYNTHTETKERAMTKREHKYLIATELRDGILVKIFAPQKPSKGRVEGRKMPVFARPVSKYRVA